MKNPFKNIFKRSQVVNVNSSEVNADPVAASLIFGSYRLDESSTSLSAFYGAMELIANSMAQVPMRVKKDGVLDTSHPLNYIFKKTLLSKFTMFKCLTIDMITRGNAYAYIVRDKSGTPVNLIYLEPSQVTINYNPSNRSLTYTATTVSKTRIEPVNMLHLTFNTRDGVQGRSVVSYANQILQLAKATDKAASKYYSSGCALQGILTIKGSRRGSKEQARAAFATTHSGDMGSGLVILDDDMSYQTISGNSKESQMLEAREFNVEEIARYFNMNPLLLGDSKGASWNSIEAANIDFVLHTLQPYISLFEDEFNRKLFKMSEVGYEIDLDEEYLMRGDKPTTAQYYSTMVQSGILSINEARQKLGYNPVSGGSENIIPYSDTSQNKLTENGEEETLPEEQPGTEGA